MKHTFQEGWFTQQPMPISRHGLASTTVGNNIYVIGGGVIPGFSFSGITEAYHNTIIPEFGSMVMLILVISILSIIVLTSTKKSLFIRLK